MTLKVGKDTAFSSLCTVSLPIEGFMAAVEKLREEATCCICLEYFKDPVSIDCGHNFCRACITQCWGTSVGSFSCPQCRQTILERTFRTNRSLGNVAELVKNMTLVTPEIPPGRKDVCKRHEEPLKLFCNDDEVPICVICRESRDHRFHIVLPIEEAAKGYREQIQTELQKLKSVRESLKAKQCHSHGTIKKHLDKIEAEKNTLVSEFEQLHQFGQEQKNLLLGKLEELQKEMEDEQKSKADGLCGQIMCLDVQIGELEGISEQPGCEFLQDIRCLLKRDTTSSNPYEDVIICGSVIRIHTDCKEGDPNSRNFQKSVRDSDLRERLDDFSARILKLKGMLEHFKETVTCLVEQPGRSQTDRPPQFQVNSKLCHDYNNWSLGYIIICRAVVYSLVRRLVALISVGQCIHCGFRLEPVRTLEELSKLLNPTPKIGSAHWRAPLGFWLVLTEIQNGCLIFYHVFLAICFRSGCSPLMGPDPPVEDQSLKISTGEEGFPPALLLASEKTVESVLTFPEPQIEIL